MAEQAESGVLVTRAGTRIRLLEQHPAHGPLSQCALALTTVGANTAELGALGVPMIVIVPTQHLEVMQAWDGAIGAAGASAGSAASDRRSALVVAAAPQRFDGLAEYLRWPGCGARTGWRDHAPADCG